MTCKLNSTLLSNYFSEKVHVETGQSASWYELGVLDCIYWSPQTHRRDWEGGSPQTKTPDQNPTVAAPKNKWGLEHPGLPWRGNTRSNKRWNKDTPAKQQGRDHFTVCISLAHACTLLGLELRGVFAAFRMCF